MNLNAINKFEIMMIQQKGFFPLRLIASNTCNDIIGTLEEIPPTRLKPEANMSHF